MKIGPVDFGERPLFLAPMEDVTDPPFRILCKQYGADMMYTEFVNSDGLIRNVKKLNEKIKFYPEERPIGIQIYGHRTDSMVDAAVMAEKEQPEVIDINFGCPVKKIANRGAGSGMFKNIPLMLEITKAVVNAVKLPVTVKTRLGWDENSTVIEEVAEMLQDCGISALTIHGRTRCQLYKGQADWTLIGKVKNNPRIKIPIIGNGDVDSPETAKEMFDRYGVDAIMIGRASVGRPWIFKEIKHFLNTGNKTAPFLVKDIVSIARKHFEQSLERKGPRGGIFEMRRHFVHYFKGLPDFRETRIKLLTSLDIAEINQILDGIDKQYGEMTDQRFINAATDTTQTL
jgi:tRNA-dihydrouridine synthase B